MLNVKDTADTLITAVVGAGTIGATGVVAETVITAEDIQTIGQLVIQTIIGVITIYRLLRKKK